MSQYELINVKPNHSDLTTLIEQLDNYLFKLYPSDEVFRVDFEDPNIDKVEFVIAYTNGKAVGCGAIKKIDETAVELKRFFVLEEYRNQGVAGLIIKHLETNAMDKNFKVIKLETGVKQLEAVGFYKKHGYYEIDKFGEYIDCSSSICMEKKL